MSVRDAIARKTGGATQGVQTVPGGANAAAPGSQGAGGLFPQFGAQHEDVIRNVLGMLPASGATAGAILGGGGGALAGLPEAGVGAIPGAAIGGTAGLSAGAGAGKALENLGLQLFGLSPHPGILAKTMGADPNSPTGQTLGVIEEMAKTAAFGKGMNMAAGPGGPQAAMGAAKRAAGQGGKLVARTALRGKLGPLYDVLESIGIKLARKGTPQMVVKQLERDPVFQQLGATITERPAAMGPEAPGLLGSAMRGQPAPTPLGAGSLGATVEQLPGAAGPTPPLFSPRFLGPMDQLGMQKLGATVGQQAAPEIAAAGPSPFEQAMTQAIQAERARPPAPVPAGTTVAPGEATRLSFGKLSPDPEVAMTQSLELEQKMNQLGFSQAQKAAVRRRVIGTPAKAMKLGNIARGKRAAVGPVQ